MNGGQVAKNKSVEVPGSEQDPKGCLTLCGRRVLDFGLLQRLFKVLRLLVPVILQQLSIVRNNLLISSWSECKRTIARSLLYSFRHVAFQM